MNPGTQFCPQDGAALVIGETHVCQGVAGVDYSTSMGRAAMNYLQRAHLEPTSMKQTGGAVLFTLMASIQQLKAALPWRTLRPLGGNLWEARP